MKIPKRITQLSLATLLLLPLVAVSPVFAAEKAEKKEKKPKEYVCVVLTDVVKVVDCNSDEFKNAKVSQKGKLKKETADKPEANPDSCKARLEKINKFAGLISNFKDYSYSNRFRSIVIDQDNPHATNLDVKKWKWADGSTPWTKTGKIKFEVNGKPTTRVNYDLILQRHEGALAQFQTKEGFDEAAFAKEVGEFSAAINESRDKVSGMEARWTKLNQGANCNNKIEAGKVKLLTKEMSKIWKDAKATRKPVQTASKEASKEYQKTVKLYKAVKSSKPRTGGAQAPN